MRQLRDFHLAAPRGSGTLDREGIAIDGQG
jgi:hypothetical protein